MGCLRCTQTELLGPVQPAHLANPPNPKHPKPCAQPPTWLTATDTKPLQAVIARQLGVCWPEQAAGQHIAGMQQACVQRGALEHTRT